METARLTLQHFDGHDDWLHLAPQSNDITLLDLPECTLAQQFTQLYTGRVKKERTVQVSTHFKVINSQDCY